MINQKLKPDDFNFSSNVEVRFRDCDQMGHVNNAVYSSYLEQARFKYLRNLGFDLHGNFTFMLVETQIRFHAAAVFEDELKIYIKVSELQKSKFTFDYIIFREKDEQKITAAHSIMVGLNIEKQRIAALDSKWVEKIKIFEKI